MKTNNSVKLSAYIITWVEFFPENGKAVSFHDQRAFGETSPSKYMDATYRRPFPTKEKALLFLNNFDKKLDQKYKCLLFSDKQFGMAREDENYAIHYTQKQLSEAYYIG